MDVYQEWSLKKIVALALVATSLAAFPVATPAFAVDTTISGLCGPDGPESYKRPGGYCEQIGSNKSLNEHQDCTYPCPVEFGQKTDEALLVAAYCYFGPSTST